MASRPSVPKKLPARIRSADGERSATFTLRKDGSGYLVSFYTMGKYGEPQFSSFSPSGVLSKAQAYSRARGWVGAVSTKRKNPKSRRSWGFSVFPAGAQDQKNAKRMLERWEGKATNVGKQGFVASFVNQGDAHQAHAGMKAWGIQVTSVFERTQHNPLGGPLTISHEGNALIIRHVENPKKARRSPKARRNPGMGDYFRAGARVAAESAASLAAQATALAAEAKQRAEAEATKRVADKPTVEQALRVLAEAHGVKLNPRPKRRTRPKRKGKASARKSGKRFLSRRGR